MKYSVDHDGFVAWLPSTWPKVSTPDELAYTLNKIFSDSIVLEIDGTINDILSHSGSLIHRGHVIAISLLCATGALSTYASTGNDNEKYKFFVANYFPSPYSEKSTEIYELYRNSFVHSWNLFKAAILPGNEELVSDNGNLCFGLQNFHEAFKSAIETFVVSIESNPQTYDVALRRYNSLRESAIQ